MNNVKPALSIVNNSVGWVERSETHQSRGKKVMGFALLNPSYAFLT
jgi:hypothetical protein